MSLYLWVTACERLAGEGWLLDAVDVRDGPEALDVARPRGVEGPMAFVSPTEEFHRDAQIGSVHENSRGWRWFLAGEQPPPLDPPFLITNELRTRCVYSGWVSLEASDELLALFWGMGSGKTWPVKCDSWFGFLRVLRPSVPLGFLWAFSDQNSAVVSGGQRLIIADLDESIEAVPLNPRDAEQLSASDANDA